MFARLTDWVLGLVFSAVSKRIAEQMTEYMGEDVEPLQPDAVKALPAPSRKGTK